MGLIKGRINKRLIFILAGLVSLSVAAGVLFWYLPHRENQALSAKLLGDERTRRDYEKILERAKKLEKNPNDIEQYTGLAFNWKSIGDNLGDKQFYYKALEAALEGLDRIPRHALLNMNTGNLYKEVGDYGKAEKYYRKAIESAPGDPQTYLLLIDLYKYNLKKSEDEIVKVYQEGLARLVSTLPLINSFAGYLRDTGQKQRALDFYRELGKAMPDNQPYKIAIQELEGEIATGG